jgi:hypothetical protein
MHQSSAIARPGPGVSGVGLILVGISAGVLLLGLVSAAPARAAQAIPVPPFVYQSGPQGLGYYPNPAAVRAAPAASSRPRTVGHSPRSRNWATGNRSPLPRPWMRARD